jgi:hypothetical protein
MRKARLILVAAFALALLAVPATADAKRRDRDHDGLPDKWEMKHHLSVHRANAKADPDHDGLTNKQELNHRTDPRSADTDNDGLGDGTEVEMGDNPNDPDTNNDGVEDGDELAGTVQGFDSGTNVLTILLSDRTTTVSGTVTDATRIRCDNSGGDGDNSGPGNGDENACTTADLTPGAVVHESELESDGNGGFVFRKVDLRG